MDNCQNCRDTALQSSVSCLRVLELYSGIGGVHSAFHVAGIPHDVVGAADVNTAVNDVYLFNFRNTHLLQRNIMSFTAKEIETLKPDILTMCPPCQPFTRLGLKQDSKDPRSESFLHIINVITSLEKKPPYIFMENVKGFECSDVRNSLILALQESGYTYQEFLLTPSQLGIPNSRLRYYLLAKLEPLTFPFKLIEEVQSKWPSANVTLKVCTHKGLQSHFHLHRQESRILPLHHFLEDESSICFEQCLLPDKVLMRYANVLDIVNKSHYNSCCFTKAYGHYVQGTGSVLHTNDEIKVSDIFENISSVSDEAQRLDILRKLRLRYFTPKEVANVMCFPDLFSFPPHMESKQRYKALGNSVNVCVVSCLLQLLISGSE